MISFVKRKHCFVTVHTEHDQWAFIDHKAVRTTAVKHKNCTPKAFKLFYILHFFSILQI